LNQCFDGFQNVAALLFACAQHAGQDRPGFRGGLAARPPPVILRTTTAGRATETVSVLVFIDRAPASSADRVCGGWK